MAAEGATPRKFHLVGDQVEVAPDVVAETPPTDWEIGPSARFSDGTKMVRFGLHGESGLELVGRFPVHAYWAGHPDMHRRIELIMRAADTAIGQALSELPAITTNPEVG